jgi:PhnB protein
MIKFQDLPEGVHTLMPMLVVHDGKAMLDFYKRALGAEEIMCAYVPDSEKIMHASMRIGDSLFAFNDEFPDHGGCLSPVKSGQTAVTIHIQVAEGMDELYRQAIDAGAQSEMEPADMFWGDRFAMVKDPAGHRWSIGMAIPNPPQVSDEELKAGLGV